MVLVRVLVADASRGSAVLGQRDRVRIAIDLEAIHVLHHASAAVLEAPGLVVAVEVAVTVLVAPELETVLFAVVELELVFVGVGVVGVADLHRPLVALLVVVVVDEHRLPLLAAAPRGLLDHADLDLVPVAGLVAVLAVGVVVVLVAVAVVVDAVLDLVLVRVHVRVVVVAVLVVADPARGRLLADLVLVATIFVAEAVAVRVVAVLDLVVALALVVLVLVAVVAVVVVVDVPVRLLAVLVHRALVGVAVPVAVVVVAPLVLVVVVVVVRVLVEDSTDEVFAARELHALAVVGRGALVVAEVRDVVLLTVDHELLDVDGDPRTRGAVLHEPGVVVPIASAVHVDQVAGVDADDPFERVVVPLFERVVVPAVGVVAAVVGDVADPQRPVVVLAPVAVTGDADLSVLPEAPERVAVVGVVAAVSHELGGRAAGARGDERQEAERETGHETLRAEMALMAG